MTWDGHKQSRRLFEEARRLMPGGVNSPVRAFGSVGSRPFVVETAEGCRLIDVDGNSLIDYVMSWGPLILGHAHPDIVRAVNDAASRGLSYGATSRGESQLAELIVERMPWIDKLRLVSSGTEACMTAIRLARAATGRDLILKFDGGYHGHSDAFLVKAGSGLATGNLPASAGVPQAVTSVTLSLPYNDLSAVEECFAERGDSIAAVIVEPVAANMGVIAPADGFLQGLREFTERNGSVLIFDEVITGFRVAPGGAGELFGIHPDLVCLGKIVGGGMPIGAIGGRQEIVDLLAPLGPVYQAGTLSGNPVSVAAGIATLERLDTSAYQQVKDFAIRLTDDMSASFNQAEIPVQINRVESLFTVFFNDRPVTDFASAQASDMNRFLKFFQHLLENGIFIPPSGYEAWFVSTEHGEKALSATLGTVRGFVSGSQE